MSTYRTPTHPATTQEHPDMATRRTPPTKAAASAPPTSGATPIGSASAVSSTIERVTPALAADWLGRNSHNRPLRNAHVEKLAGAIARGEWILNGDAIRFADDGTLLDGQHRLWAVVEADEAIETLVLRGLPRESQQTMDAGARRNLTDALRLRGESNASALAAAVAYFWRLDNGYVRLQSQRPTIAQATATLDEHPGLREFVRVGAGLNKRFRVSAAMVIAVAYQLDTIDPEDAAEFWRLLDSGAGLEEGSPILVLRRWLETQSIAGVGSKANALTTHALIVKAWNAWRQGQHVQRLNWKASGTKAEAFPEPV